ncbi:arylamine N-acetyltransferase 1 [Desmophyllum pertusum]|uniref:arylamine N-acetyltransferase n=1 Tax=Desmophyllum pertusum TaxID=174260 RepID=A0A9W9Y8A9_9CNID|nr:arylamine N-acetyltransferase 1 [Desmophyllum pertusum]
MEREHFTPNEVQEYLARIHYTGPIEPTIEALTELQRCHMLSVPFENLSVFGKEKIILSKDWLFDKIVRRNRGGFCYELNTLYSMLLDYFGFKYEIYAGMVYSRKTGVIGPPIDHVVPTISIEDDLWMSDLSFGDACLTPLRFSGLPQKQQSGIYRIRKDRENYFFEEKVKIIVDEFGHEEMAKERFLTEPGWAPRYKFDLIPRTTGNFHERLLYHQTDTRSAFTHDRICTMAKPWGRVTLSGSKVITSTYLGDNKVKKETKELLGGEEEIVKELEEKFGIRREACLYPEGSMLYGLEWRKETL